MSNELKILLSGSLDFSKTQSAIDNQIAALEKKISKVKINIDLNDNTIRTMQKFSRAVEDYKRSYDELNKSVQENVKIIKRADGVVDKYTTRLMKNGNVEKQHKQIIDEKSKIIDNNSNKIKQNIRELEKQANLQKRVNNEAKKSSTETYGDKYKNKRYEVDDKGNVSKSPTVTENFAKADRDIAQLKQKLTDLNSVGRVTENQFKQISNSIDAASSEKEINKISRALKNLDSSAKAQSSVNLSSSKISDFKANAELDAEKLKRSRRSTVDNDGLNAYLDRVKKLSVSTPNAEQEIKSLRAEFKRLSLDANSSATAMGQFGRNSVDAFKKFGQWMLVGGSFAAIASGMQNMVSQIIEIDTAMTDLRRVMDAPEAGYSNYLKEAIGLSNELGNSLKDVLNIGTEFARMGFDSSQLVDMTKTAQVLQNISDLDSTQAVDTLTAAMNNFGIAAQDSMTIADQLNDVDNNFAISTADLADGIRKAGSTAKTFGELVATY
ncbi:phage tail tape measure protein [Priestia megaterium]|uniref:phage tail tape measure protein n=1 Tax=Priestia megaterium TaxID=1404 RepID=UPI003CC63F97